MIRTTYLLRRIVHLLCSYFRLKKLSWLFSSILLLFLCQAHSYSQVLNVTQAGLIEDGFGKTPNLTGAYVVAVQGNYAYSVGTGNVLEILDITLPGLPTHKGSIANGEGGANIQRAQALVVRGNYAYISSYGGNALEIVDVSNPSKPIHKGILHDGGGSAPYLDGVSALYVSGNYAYLGSTNTAALEIIDISNPAAPTHKGSLLDGVGGAYLSSAASIKVVGDLAYVGCFGALEIVDVSNPAAPVHKGKLLDGGGVAPYLATGYGLSVSGNYAYVTSYNDDETGAIINNALEIVDISNPLLPVHKGSVLDGGGNPPYLSTPFSVAVSGDYAYVGNYDSFKDASNSNRVTFGFEVINISNPTTPVHAAALKDNYFYQCLSIALMDNKIYLTSRGNNSLSIVDVADPLLPKLIATAQTPTEGGAVLKNPKGIIVSGSNAYVASSNGLEIIDITTPSQPLHKSSLSSDQIGLSASAISVSGTLAYLSGLTKTIAVADISNTAIPTLKFIVNAAGNNLERFTIPAIQVEQRIVFAGLSKNNSGPLESGENYVAGIRILYTGDGGSTPTSIYATLTHGTGGALLDGITSLCKTTIGTNQYLFATSAASNALEIVDITDFHNPVHKGKIINGTNGALLITPKSVIVSGNYAYVASYGSNALEIIDFTNPALPEHKSNITHGQGGAFLEGPTSVYIAGNYAFVSCAGTTGNGGLEVIDISDPANPKHYGTLLHGTNGALLDGASAVTVSGNYAYVLNNGLLYQNMDVAYLYGPSLTSFSPATGAAGTSVTITGQNFNTFLTADVNGAAGDVTAVTATSLTFTVPSAATNGKITLNYAGQKFTSATSFIVSPTTTVATDLQQNSFTTHWTDVGATNYTFDLSTDNFSTFVGAYHDYAVGNKTSLAITGLNPATNYQYRVRSSDGTSVSSSSNTTSVITISATPVATDATAINQTNFTANWSAVTGATNYFLDVATDGAFTKFLVGYNNLSIPATSDRSQIITGLTSFTHYYYRVRAGNATGSSPSSNVINAITLDITVPVISNPLTPNPATLTVGASPVFNSVITDNVSISSAKLFYRGISQRTFKNAVLQGPGGLGGNYSITVQSDWYDSLGMEYYFEAVDEAGNEAVGTRSYVQLITPSITLPQLPSGSSQSDYRIVSFPYQLPDNKVTTIYNNVPWNDNTKAGLWWWNPSQKSGAGDYDQYGVSTTLQTIESGKGYWVITASPVSPTLSNVPSPKYNQSNLYSMTLKPDWNEVGNPYPVPISWDDVIAYNAANNPGASFGPLNIYDGSGYKAASGSTLLPAFEGGFVKNLGSSDITIQIPFKSQTISGGRVAVMTSDISNENWNVFLHINQNDRTNQLGGFGMHRTARSGPDHFDNYNPPTFLGIPEVNFTNAEYSGMTFSNDVVTSQEEYTWTFTPSGTVGNKAQLAWDVITNNSSKQLFLLDEESLAIIDMSQITQYDFVLSKASHFRIFYGNDVEKKITTSNIVASAPYPNPLTNESKVSIKLALPESSSNYSVYTQIFNGQGAMIGSLSNQFSSGIHSLEFTLPESLSQGIFIYKLAITSEKVSSIHTGKIIKL